MEPELMEALLEVKQKLLAINDTDTYAWARFAREQDFLRCLVADIPGAADKPGIYHNPIVAYGYRISDVVHKRVLMAFCKAQTVAAIEQIMSSHAPAPGRPPEPEVQLTKAVVVAV